MLKKIPLIYDAHEIYHIMEWEKYNKFVRYFIFCSERILLKFVDNFIVVNQIRKDFYQKYYKNNIIIIGNWYDPYNGENIDLRKEFNIKEDGLIFGYFGNLNKKVRCLDFIINSVLEIPNAHLLIAGDGHDYKYIEEISKRNKRIHFLGWIDNVRKYFNNLNYIFYFINAERKYYNYAAPNTIYLSISHSIPLITNTPGEPENLIKEYNIGYFIEKDEKLFNKIESNINSDSYVEMVNNINKIKNDYTWSISCKIYSQIFELN